MPWERFENASAVGTAPRRCPFPPRLLAFAGGLVAVIATFALVGDVHQRLLVWPVSGILMALILPYAPMEGRQRLPVYCSSGVGVFAGGCLAGMPPSFALFISTLTTLDLVIAGLLLIPHVRAFDDLKQRRNGMRLMLTSVLAPLLTGVLGVLRVAAFLQTPPLVSTSMSVLADALGIVILVPAVLFITTGYHFVKRKLPAKPLPLALSLSFFTLVCCGVFWQESGPYLFMVFPPLVLLLLVCGLEGAVFASMLVSIVGPIATARGHGPICLARTISFDVRLVTLQVFIWVCIVTALTMGAAVDERRKAELSATNSRSVQQTILKHAREAIVLSSLDGRERYASAAIEQLTGWTPSEYVSFDRFETVHPDDRERAREMLKTFSDGTRETSFRYRILHKNGRWTWVEATLCTYGEDKIAGYVGTVRDIARLIETEQGWSEERRVFSAEQQRLSEAETAAKYQLKLRDEFLSHVSHELRSPLTSIYSFSSIIADGLAGETTPEQNEYLGIVLKNVVQLQSMIEDLLTVTQSREGKLNIELQPASLTEAATDALDTVRGFAQRKRIALTLDEDLCKGSALVYADPTRVRQVLIILLDNALKFTPEGGSVRVTIASRGSDSFITKVIDTGCGIPKEKCDLVFNKLYQVEGPHQQDTSAAGRTGLGLGLHIARSLIVRQSGHIWVTSVPGEGSVFQFTLPRYTQQDSSYSPDGFNGTAADLQTHSAAHVH